MNKHLRSCMDQKNQTGGCWRADVQPKDNTLPPPDIPLSEHIMNTCTRDPCPWQDPCYPWCASTGAEALAWKVQSPPPFSRHKKQYVILKLQVGLIIMKLSQTQQSSTRITALSYTMNSTHTIIYSWLGSRLIIMLLAAISLNRNDIILIHVTWIQLSCINSSVNMIMPDSRQNDFLLQCCWRQQPSWPPYWVYACCWSTTSGRNDNHNFKWNTFNSSCNPLCIWLKVPWHDIFT